MTEEFIEIDSLECLRDAAIRFARLGNQYLVARIKGNIEHLFGEGRTFRLHGVMILKIRNGHLKLEVNLEKYELFAGHVIVLNPGAVVTEAKTSGKSSEWEVVFASTEFMKDLNMDLSSVNVRSITAGPSPAMQLTRDESDRFSPYVKMLASNAENETSVFTVKIARAIFTATIYQILDFFYARVVKNGVETSDKSTKYRRPTTYVRDFMKLLHLNYMRERSSEFYASQLCISSKYLSIIVKEVTGRSVSDWISEFVVMEAKNLLRFSGKSVQQVAYALNFSTQSSFGKYFKRLTGISPTEYQRT
ncbi:MAG: helix-turn-helix domain-containing protein [Muribaculaceae bacterium]|nr:helix-turn-helix domain-containing protein [Muribaculaceae bacterium]